LATEDQLLPLELRTIPANGSNKAMEFSWNAITENQVFTALLWLYANKDAGLFLAKGKLMNGETVLADGANLPYIHDIGYTTLEYPAVLYIFQKMGYSVLSGAELIYANTMTRLELAPRAAIQYAYRWIEK
jgi:hypothetical protein